MLIYRDGTHITATYMQILTDWPDRFMVGIQKAHCDGLPLHSGFAKLA
ncbi:MAG: hypothetical protein WCA46_23800 [Actinocatenispora sp.]